METIAPEFSTCHCYEVARGGCAVRDCLRNTFQAVATPCTLHVWADTWCSSPSSITAAARARLWPRCTSHLISLMSPALPMVWLSSFKGKYGKASLSCKLSCSLSPSLNILLTTLYFSLHAATALLSSNATVSVSPAIFLNWFHFCMVPLAKTLKHNKESYASEMLCAHPLSK